MTDLAPTPEHPDLSIDQQLALRTAAGNLTRLFAGIYGPETIERFLATSYEQFADRSTIPHYTGDRAIAWSGGCEPGHEIIPAAVTAMAERGIDITGEFPKPWTDEIVRAATVVITMGCGDACPVFPGTRYENWELDDPDGLDLAAVRPIRDDLERRVRTLLDQLDIPAGRN